MEIIFTAFANSRDQPLPTLTEEYMAINRRLPPGRCASPLLLIGI